MYNQDKFIEILKQCQGDLSLNEYARISGVDVGYLWRIMNKKKRNPPSPNILKRIAETSKCITTYDELMYMCGYTDKMPFGYGIVDRSVVVLPLFISQNGKLEQYTDLIIDKSIIEPNHQYFAYKCQDESMSPALGIGDSAIIEKTDTFKDNQIYLLSLDDKIMIRIIKDYKGYIELQALNYHFDSIKLTKEEMEKRKFKIIGKVIKAENESVFK